MSNIIIYQIMNNLFDYKYEKIHITNCVEINVLN